MPETEALQAYIPKGKAFLDVDTSQFNEEMYSGCFMHGLIPTLCKGLDKIKTQGLEGEELEKAQQAAMDLAQENLQKLYDGEFRFTRAKAKKISGKVRTEALRDAKVVAKSVIRASGEKISHYTARQITEMAEYILEQNPDMLEEARKRLEEQEAKSSGKIEELKINLKGKLTPDPKRVNAAEDKKRKAKAPAQRQRGETRANA